jgi:hypothetical protein
VTLAKDVEPVKIGVLMDIISSGSGNEESGSMKDLLDPLRMIFNDAVMGWTPPDGFYEPE